MTPKKKIDVNNKQFTYTKIIISFCLLVFMACVIYTFFAAMNPEVSEGIIVALLTSTSALASICVLSYCRKSQLENNQKANITMYEKLTANRLKYERGVLTLQREFGVDRETIDQIDESGDADEFVQSALDRSINDMNTFADEAHAMIEKPDIM